MRTSANQKPTRPTRIDSRRARSAIQPEMQALEAQVQRLSTGRPAAAAKPAAAAPLAAIRRRPAYKAPAAERAAAGPAMEVAPRRMKSLVDYGQAAGDPGGHGGGGRGRGVYVCGGREE
jgi:hypothetical protein